MMKPTAESKQPITLPEPRLLKADCKTAAVAVGDPSVTIIEAHEALGFLLSESCYDSMVGAKIHFETVNWVRQVYQTGNKVFRTFPEVALTRHDSGSFVVQDMGSKNYFPCPSKDPYFVQFLSKDQYDELHAQIQKEDLESLLKSLGPTIQNMPGIYFKENRLVAPLTYAQSTGVHFSWIIQ